LHQPRANLKRRLILQCALALPLAVPVASAHTPYGQWAVYRRKHLLIGCHKTDPETYAWAGKLVDVLQAHLPAASSRVARAPSVQRLASLLGTEQLDVAILSDRKAQDMARGVEEFVAYGEIALATLALLPQHALVCRSQIPARHAWLISAALQDNDPALDLDREPPLPWHQGAALYRSGAPVPP